MRQFKQVNLKHLLAFIIFCLFSIFKEGKATDIAIEIIDYNNQLVRDNTALRIDFIDERGLKSKTTIPLDGFSDPILNFKVCSLENAENIKSIAAFLYKNEKITSYAVLDNRDLANALLKNKIRFLCSPALVIDTILAYPSANHFKEQDSRLYVTINKMPVNIGIGHRFYRNANFIMCRQPSVVKDRW